MVIKEPFFSYQCLRLIAWIDINFNMKSFCVLPVLIIFYAMNWLSNAHRLKSGRNSVFSWYFIVRYLYILWFRNIGLILWLIIFKKLLIVILLDLRVFVSNLLRRSLQKKCFFRFLFLKNVWPGLWIEAFKFWKSIHYYIMNYGGFWPKILYL